ncbi:hypothetical protein CspeluHIS016_0105220 [Cutaneotrichosporon spelunceum]|uniref:MICOS complex subunit MIC60 n=1 Tax=Cutaneotrichosporon spelunceum TaxID=1672016 RepID=A0AAD3TN63_9TREE|nr:hypothetical protein CspeluHIS016_0105220 [Cutaneotrichosporon spelunceum]
MQAQIRLPARGARTLVQRRLITTTPVRFQQAQSSSSSGATSGSSKAAPRKSAVRRLVFWTTLGVLVYYPVSALVSTHNEKYRDVFVKVPGGEQLADYADEHGWENFGPGTIAQMAAKLTSTNKGDIQSKFESAKRAAEAKAHEAAAMARSSAADAQKRMHDAADAARTKATGAAQEMREKAEKTAAEARVKAEKAAADFKEKTEPAREAAAERANEVAQATKGVGESIAQNAKGVASAIGQNTNEISQAVADKIRERTEASEQKIQAEADEEKAKDLEKIKDALAHRFPDTAKPRALRPETVQPQKRSYEGQEKYDDKLPIGFEPPPGFYIPPPPSKPKNEEDKLPLLAPKVKGFVKEEPIIGQLASTIDSLTTTLSSAKGAASAEAAEILAKAQTDLSSLNKRLDEVKKTEQERLQRTVDSKTREFEAELEARKKEWSAGSDKLKSTWEAERQKMIDGWRGVLDVELEAQRENIEARLKDEVVSQGIELQRRWLRSIKSQVETERGGRLAKLDTLTTSLKQLERITLDNSAALDDNVKLHKIWSALRAVQSKADHGNVSFDDEVRVLHALATPADPDSAGSDDTVMQAALTQLEASGIPQTGVKSFSDLASWFSTSVAPRIHEASLVPAPEDATVASHLASAVLSKLLFRPKAGLVAGSDVGSVLARAEWALGEKDLDAATREVNSLTGWPRKLADDWLREARRKLEVQQALDVFATEATLSSLLMV